MDLLHDLLKSCVWVAILKLSCLVSFSRIALTQDASSCNSFRSSLKLPCYRRLVSASISAPQRQYLQVSTAQHLQVSLAAMARYAWIAGWSRNAGEDLGWQSPNPCHRHLGLADMDLKTKPLWDNVDIKRGHSHAPYSLSHSILLPTLPCSFPVFSAAARVRPQLDVRARAPP